MGLEGIVSKRRDGSHRAGPCKDWIKVKNPSPRPWHAPKTLSESITNLP